MGKVAGGRRHPDAPDIHGAYSRHTPQRSREVTFVSDIELLGERQGQVPYQRSKQSTPKDPTVEQSIQMTVKSGDNRCKGSCFHDFKSVVCRVHGDPSWPKVLSRLDREVADAIRYRAVVSGGWYPLSWYHHLHIVTHMTLDVGFEFSREVGRLSTIHALTTGLYKVFMKVVSPKLVITNAPSVFGSYYERGRMIIEEKRSGYVRASWTHCVDFSRAIWEDVFGGCLGALQAAGAKGVQIRVLGGGRDGSDNGELEAKW
jgi:hypothetical protein